MKPLYRKYETDKAQALLKFNLVALLAETVAELAASELDRLCIRLVRPNISGALLLSNKNFAGNYIVTDGDEVSVNLVLPAGKNRLTVEAEFGTNTRTLAIVDIFTTADATGTFEPEAITTPVVKQLTDVSREEFTELQENVTEIGGQIGQAAADAAAAQQSAGDARQAAQDAQQQAQAAQDAAEGAQQTAEAVNDALQEVISTGDIPAATVAKVAEHTTQIEQLNENKADKNGYFPQLSAGSADNLNSKDPETATFKIRPTGGEVSEVANGIASVKELKGDGCAWNQLFWIPDSDKSTESDNVTIVDNRDGSYTISTTQEGASDTVTKLLYAFEGIKVGHKYFVFGLSDNESIRLYDGTSSSSNLTTYVSQRIFTPESNYGGSSSVRIRVMNGAIITNPVTIRPQLIDLTLLGIDNLTTVAEVEAWLALHIGIAPYYAYNAVELLGADVRGFQTTGKNANLLNPSTRTARLFEYSWPQHDNMFTIKGLPAGNSLTFAPDATGTAEIITPDADGHFVVSGNGVLTIGGADDLSAVWLVATWDEALDDYDNFQPWDGKTFAFDTTKLYGKLNGAGDYVQLFAAGLRGVKSVRDVLNFLKAEAVINIGSRAYEEGDESDATVITDGTNTWYVLATPQVYTDVIYRDGELDTPVSELSLLVNNWAYEEVVLADFVSGSPKAIAPQTTILYGIDAAEQIDTLKKTYISVDALHDNMDALLTALVNGGIIGSYILSATPNENRVFSYEVTAPTPEPEPEPEP